MRTREAHRALLWAIVIAAILGIGVGWFARKWYHPSAEDRARERAEQIRDRIREMTH
jgi:uncharacterized membrane protein YqiK